MADLGSAYVNIVPKAPGISGKIEEVLNEGQAGAEKSGSGFGKKILSGIAAVGIGTAVTGFIKDAFEAGGNLEQSFGGLDTLYGEASAAAKQYAMDAAQAGISANNYAEQAVSFGAALKAAYGGDTAKAAEAANTAILDMADNAAKMGTPLESLQNAYQGFAKGNYTMLDNLKLGYGGTKQEMERLLEDAQKLTGVEYNIENLGDVYSAIHAVQEELGLTGVAAGEAATTLSGSLGSLKASWENVMAAMTTGEGLDTAMSNLSGSVVNFGENVLRMFSTLGPQVPTLISGLADMFITNAPDLIRSGVELIIQLGLGLIQGIPDLIAQLPSIFMAVIDAFAGFDWNQIGLDIVNGIIVGLDSAATMLWEALKSLAMSAWESMKNALGIGSPSKVFAQEVGRWIPAGVAVGIDENVSPVDAALETMLDPSAVRLSGSPASVGAGAGPPGMNAQQLLDALRGLKFDFFLDGKQITDCVTVRQRQAARSGGVAV